MDGPPLATTWIGGDFVRIAFAGTEDASLERGRPDRPPARFNRPGQDALYLAPDAESAMVAIGGTVAVGDPPRVLRRYEVSPCAVVDLRSPGAGAFKARASAPWRTPIAAGEVPASWDAADEIRAMGFAGLIDPSRRRPGLWLVTLFAWNGPGAPSVRRSGGAEPVEVPPDYR